MYNSQLFTDEYITNCVFFLSMVSIIIALANKHNTCIYLYLNEVIGTCVYDN